MNEINSKKDNLGYIGQPLDKMKLAETGIPEIIMIICNYFYLNEEYFDILGIFRVSGSKNEEIRLENSINNNDFETLNEIKDPKVAASKKKIIYSVQFFYFYKLF